MDKAYLRGVGETKYLTETEEMTTHVCLDCYNQFDSSLGNVTVNNGMEEFICSECAGK
jgi:hypothetical protein